MFCHDSYCKSKKKIKKPVLKTSVSIDAPIAKVWEGKEYEGKGCILEFENEKKLKYNYWSYFAGTEDLPENYANITYELSEQSSKTVFTLTQDGFKTKKQHYAF